MTESSIVKAISVNSKGEKSLPVEAKLVKIPHDWTVNILSKYNRQYTGGGDEGLIDGIRGTTNFASGEWQGYQDQDFVAVIDLKRETEITKLGGSFLQDARPWIWMPTRIEFEVSSDGETFQESRRDKNRRRARRYETANKRIFQRNLTDESAICASKSLQSGQNSGMASRRGF